ncbi:hypothetical protein F5Y01DRAFT_322779 [Xylaria sp. FL0043]|nr:hypothetical protein F5Y01DRAFT_322779 [Xylaria sp. FL0043]
MERVQMKAAYTVSPDAAQRRLDNASFRKRTDTLFWKGNQLHEKFGAEVYIAIKHRSQWWEYSSNPDHSFPLSRDDIHTGYPPVKATTPQTFVPRHTSRIIKQPIPVPEAISPEIGSQSTNIPANVAQDAAIQSVHAGNSNEEHLELQHLDRGNLTHDATDAPCDSRQFAPPLSQVGEANIGQQPIKRGRGRPRGSGRPL